MSYLKDEGEMPKTVEEIRDSEMWEYERYGVKLSNINEDFDYIAFGHVEPRRFAAALHAYAGEFVYDATMLDGFSLSDFDELKYEWGEFWFNDDGWYFTEVAASSPFAVPYTRFF